MSAARLHEMNIPADRATAAPDPAKKVPQLRVRPLDANLDNRSMVLRPYRVSACGNPSTLPC